MNNLGPIHTKTGATDTATIYMDLRNIMLSGKKTRDSTQRSLNQSTYMKFKNRQNESTGLKVRTVATSGWKTLTSRGL